MALCPGLVALPRNGAAERAALERLAGWAGQFTSRVCLALPAAMLLEIGGSLSLFGGLESLVGRVGRGLQALGYQCLLATAPTPLAAEWLARSGSCRHCPSREALAAAVAGLPLEVLAVSERDRTALVGMGLRCIGDLLAQPRDGLTRRFGMRLGEALDRALGVVPDPRPVFEPPGRLRAELDLPAEITDATVLTFPLKRLLEEFSAGLRGRCQAVQTLRLRLLQCRGAGTEVTLALSRPTADAAHMLGLLRERLERVRPSAPINGMVLESGTLLSAPGCSDALFAAAEQSRGLDTLLDRLRARLGNEAVYGLAPVSDHRPERAWCRVTVGRRALAAGREHRPLWLLSTPQRLALRSGRPWLEGPVQLLGRGERIESGWWDGAEVRRAYYRALGPGGMRLWVYRDLAAGGTRWYLHGLFA